MIRQNPSPILGYLSDLFDEYLEENCELSEYVEFDISLDNVEDSISSIQKIYNELKRDENRSHIAFGGQCSYAGAAYIDEMMRSFSSIFQYPLICFADHEEDKDSQYNAYWSDDERADEYRKIYQLIMSTKIQTKYGTTQETESVIEHLKNALKGAEDALISMIANDIAKDPL